MSDSIINAPSTSTTSDNTNFTTEQTNEDIRHKELLCKLDDLNDNLKILVAYFDIIMGQTITKDDV